MWDTAYTQLGVPWRHQARAWGRYLDCLGLVTGTAQQLGLPVEDHVDYARHPDTERLLRTVREQMVEIDVDQDLMGSVMLIHFGDWDRPYHFAISDGEGRMLHGYALAKKVVYHSVDDYWSEKISFRFELPGITE